ncbi:hypothetical protein BDV27DRAFT_56798 [Aspergillus caelatus]|uniref:Uncharacterized protein n=1 Tax=Aspergillus caelatus TaxID=61420 RepID=A0A5N6ZNK5_9EURO|nr:uncharacterized protein BDV27DRAFT_56798 [Aspergillus caelatus]KAE8359197.1 hypothetical protein BDV27DRAFT_56798 [Aspergillus caelatus]
MSHHYNKGNDTNETRNNNKGSPRLRHMPETLICCFPTRRNPRVSFDAWLIPILSIKPVHIIYTCGEKRRSKQKIVCI